MKLIDSSATLITEENPLKKIELAGRTCYKSEKNITEESAEKFVAALHNNKHHAMLEHAVFTFIMPNSDTIQTHPYFRTDLLPNNPQAFAVTANLRAICEGKHTLAIACRDILCREQPQVAKVMGWEETMYAYEGILVDASTLPNEIRPHHQHITFRFICDRGVTHELVRHRPCSFAQESTRYVSYSAKKDNIDPEIWNKYEEAMKAYEAHQQYIAEQAAKGITEPQMEKPERPIAEITFIKPADWNEAHENKKNHYIAAFEYAERAYNIAIENDDQPQQARALLPNAIKTEIVVTAALTEWNHIMNLRYHGTTGKPHPDMKLLMEKAYPLYEKLAYTNN